VASHGNDVAKLCDGSLGERVGIDALALAKLDTTIGLNTTTKRSKQAKNNNAKLFVKTLENRS
jgi:hypothetical protein